MTITLHSSSCLRPILCLLLLGFLCNGIAQPSNWSAVVPGNFPVNASGQINGISRVSQMKFHPTNPNKMYAISARGGLFISNDGANSWNVAPGTDFMPGAHLASVCIDYNNDSIIYLGTGDHDYYSNGTGVWKSVNGGQTFTQTSLNSQMIVEMLMDPRNDSIIVACTNKGIYKTYNAGSTWAAKTATTLAFDDMKKVASPVSRSIFACTNDSSLYRSTDFGETWIQLTNGIRVPTGFTSGDGCRIAVTPADTTVVYLGMVVQGGTIFKSTNLGNSFVAEKNTYAPYLTYYDDTSSSSTQGDYNFNIGVDNRNPNILYLVAQNVWRSLDGGHTWTELTHWYAEVHTDMHQVNPSPYNAGQLWNMNDGGVWLSLDSGNTWTPKGNGLFGYEVYHGNCSPTRSDMMSVGTQDNGELYVDSAGWFTNRGGDWSPECAFDYRPASSMVYYYNSNQRRIVSGGTQTYGLSVNELQDIAFSRSNDNLAFAADTIIYRTVNLLADTPTWVQISNFGKVVMSMRSSLANSNKLFVITNDGNIHVSNNALAATPTFTTHTLPNTTNNAAGITTISNKPGVVYVICNTKVYRSTDTGTTWTNITYNLPSVNQVQIISDEFYPDSELVFIASNDAVYYKTGSQTTWTLFDAHLPTRPSITDMSIYNDSTANSMLRVAVYGRGMWQTPISALRPLNAIMTTTVNSGCVGFPITFNDISTGVVASRLWSFPGGSPATSTLPNPVVSYPAYGVYPVSLKVYSTTDSASVTNLSYISITPGISLNVTQGFEGSAFPPTGWSLTDPGNDGFTWQHYTSAGAYGTSSACMFFDNYNEDAGGNVNDIITQRYDFTGYSTVKLSFDRAYQQYNNTNEIDSFAILISTDCGEAYTQVYRIGGSQLATVPGLNSYTAPAPGDWKSDTIDLSVYTGGSAIVAFRNIGHYGNDLFIDNINISGTVRANGGPDKALCLGDSATLGAASIAPLAYQWTPSIGLSSDTISNPSAAPSTTTTYFLTTTQPYSGISAHDTVKVTVNRVQVAVNGSAAICYGAYNGSIIATASAGSGQYSYRWSNGELTSTDDTLVAGLYNVTVHDIATGCSLTAVDSILQQPEISIITTGDTIPCASTGGMANVTASGGLGTFTFKWNTGDSTSAITSLNTGNYTVTVTDSTGCKLVGFATVAQAGSPPQLNVGLPDTLTCSVHSITISASSTDTAIIYRWNNGAAGEHNTVSAPGSYAVIATDSITGCNALDTVQVVQSILTGSFLIAADRSMICPGDTAFICASSTYSSYAWNTGDSVACIAGFQTGSFYVTVKDSTGCVDTSNHVSVALLQAPVATVLARGDTLYLSTIFSTYQWQRNGNIIQGATNSTYLVNTGGSYTVVVTDSSGCSAVSNQKILTGLENLWVDKIEVYPNPLSSGAWTLEVSDQWIGSFVELSDETGKVIYRAQIANQKTQIAPTMAAGVYFLRVVGKTDGGVIKLVKL